MSRPLRVAVIGFGYWGPKLVRNFTELPDTHVSVVADHDESRRAAVNVSFPWIKTVSDVDEVLGDDNIDAIAIATPLSGHAPIAKAALEAGKHVLVEPPLAHSAEQCEQLLALAAANQRTLMVDHTFVYGGAVRKIRELLDDGRLGEVLYFDSVRTNLGLFQRDHNVIWDLAQHDLSILDHVLNVEPRWVSAVGACHYDEQENLAYVTIGFDNELLAHLHCNWVTPVKARRITIAGSYRTLVYDDTVPGEQVKLYDRGVDADHLDLETSYRMNAQYRTGDVMVPKLDAIEPLRAVVTEFTRACSSGTAPITDGEAGLRVVRLLEAAQESLENDSERVEL